MDKVKRAIINMFKEDGRTVTDITDTTVTAVGFREVTYNYEVIGDIVKVTNKLGSTVYEKSIRSYQDLNVSAIINK